MEPIIDYLRRRLKEAGASRWGPLAEQLSASLPLDSQGKPRFTFHSLRKIAYGDRDNPGLTDAQALLDYFHAVDRGERELPEPEKAGA